MVGVGMAAHWREREDERWSTWEMISERRKRREEEKR